MEKVTIRHASPADADAIAHFHVRVWRQTYRDLAPPEIYAALDENLRRNTWREKLAVADPDQIVLLAELEGRPVGIGAAGAPSDAIFGDLGEIKNLCVDPDVKRQGIGRLLLSRLALHLRERGFPGVGLSVVDGNEPAIAFYDAIGGKRAGEYTDAGPIWRSRNIVFVWADSLVL
ncbi:GNAT family N-acetyltransferase [Sinorhizobium sp. NFACC03]|uniref:GNAT family N-acetyltransferase n=1 Tax=Sinorhizobium sp. NFACC03 TaxID=1566295 RepID=UPI000888A3C7|nr:GNAT family N-acetyltransferase [Sinorhizobium sp. NFACC03]SDA95640.1 Ribosomal protein S18 acetylase RimI [Sinorhizobium sp. NFACC03]